MRQMAGIVFVVALIALGGYIFTSLLSGQVVHTDELASEIERLEIVTDGKDGQDGDAGLPGYNCWDLDMDRENDPFEDSNSDGVWDTADCRGAQGDQGPKGDRGLTGARGPQGEPGVCPDCSTASSTPPPVVTSAPTPRRPRIVINRSVHVDARGRVRVEAPVTIQGDGVEFNGDVTTTSRRATVIAPITSR